MDQSTRYDTGVDLLGILFYVAAAIFAVIAIALPVAQIFQYSASTTLNISPAVSEKSLQEVKGLPENVILLPTGTQGLTVNAHALRGKLDYDASIGEERYLPIPLHIKLLSDLPTSTWAAGLAVISLILGRIFHSIAQNDPFNERQSRRWIYVGIAILVASIGADTLGFISALRFTSYFGTPSSLEPTAYYSIVPPAIALVSFVLASAFRSGRRIQEDTEGLI